MLTLFLIALASLAFVSQQTVVGGLLTLCLVAGQVATSTVYKTTKQPVMSVSTWLPYWGGLLGHHGLYLQGRGAGALATHPAQAQS